MRLAHIVYLGVKELRGLLRNTALLFLIVFSFSVQVYTGAKAVPEVLNRAPIAIVDEDQSPVSSRIVSAFYPPHFVPPQLISQAEMDSRMDAGLDTFALDIPPNFQRDLLSGLSPTIQLNIDATRMSQAFSGGGYVQAIVSGEIDEFLAHHRQQTRLPVEIDVRARFNPELNMGWFGSINELIEAITMLSVILTGAALIREREHGTIEHLLVMPVTAFEIMTAKLWSMGLVVLLASGLSMIFVVKGLLAVPTNGSLVLFMTGAALDIFAMTCLGLFLATVAGAMPQFALLVMMVLMPLQLLSGGVTPRENMPEIIQAIMYAAPNTHFVMLAQAVLFRGAGLAVVWPQLVALLVIGIALCAISLQRFRRFLG
ncbi:ABC transporter permease [Aureimonas glaciei]|uniref:ABC transporter permease n=1 Tax=Aureimonas glaciei TaxID=1776957 RepID=A0A917DF37_9HYPH|nr:ABC transporter permease [Aureimonas glaciei]GGD35038.1 ABC transporter permease [Aureimonas glaciei]